MEIFDDDEPSVSAARAADEFGDGVDATNDDGLFDSEDDDNDDDNDNDTKRRKRPLQKGKKGKKASKRAKKNSARSFFLDEAEDADGSDEEDGEWERGAAEGADLNEEEKAANALVEERHRKNREMLDTDAAEIAARYERKHRQDKDRSAALREVTSRSGSGVGTGIVNQQALLPDTSDAPIFRVKCVPGMELQLIRSIFLKHVDLRSRGATRSTLKSAFCSAAKGYIYVEAGSEVHARQAVIGLRGLYVRSFTKAPLSEMVQVVTVEKGRTPLEAGQWCRLRRGPLKGDLCKVVEVLEGGLKAFIMAVPRPDFSQSKKLPPGIKAPRPPQRLFDSAEAHRAKQDKDVGTDVQRRDHPSVGSSEKYDFWCNDYYKGGFLYKEVTAETYLNPQDVKPRLEELQLFRARKVQREYDDEEDQNEDEEEAPHEALLQELAAQMKTIEEQQASVVVPFVSGDLVQVISGDLLHLICKIIRIEEGEGSDGKKVVCEPYSRDSLQRASFTIESELLVKYVAPGLHVKIVAGRYSGLTGRVVSVTTLDGEQVATILSDGTNSEMRVNVGSVQISNEISGGHGDLGGYELYDLVSLSVNETAMIVQVGSERLRLLTHMDIVKDILPQEVQRKRNQQSNRSTGFDAQQATVSVGDLVDVRTGAYIKKKGTVKAIMNGCFWLHSTSHLKNSGVFVIRGRQCVLSGRSKASLSAISSSSSSSSSSAMPARATGGGIRAAPDAAIGMTVKIIKGGFKGFLAQVVDATQTTYTVELLARVKKIVIDKTKCKICGDKEGSTAAESHLPRSEIGYGVTPIGGDTPYGGGATPFNAYGSETPLHPSVNDSDGPNPFNASERDREEALTSEEFGMAAFNGQPSPVPSQSSIGSWDPSRERAASQHSPSVLSSNASSSHNSPLSSVGSPLPDAVLSKKEERELNVYKRWPVGMFVVCRPAVHQSKTGMLAQIEQVANLEGKLRISLCPGQAESGTTLTHFTELEPVPITKDDRVYLIDDDKGYENMQGHAVKKIGKDFVVRIVPDPSKPLPSIGKILLVKKEAQLVKIEGPTFVFDFGEGAE